MTLLPSLRQIFTSTTKALPCFFGKIKKLLSKKRTSKGTAIGISLALTSGVLIAAVGVSSVIVEGTKNVSDVDRSNKAYFAAERGIEYSLYDISGHLGGYEVGNPEFNDPNAQSYLPDSQSVSAWRIQSKIEVDEITNTIHIPPKQTEHWEDEENWGKIPWKGSVSIPLYIDNTAPAPVDADESSFVQPLIASSQSEGGLWGVQSAYANVNICSNITLLNNTVIEMTPVDFNLIYKTRQPDSLGILSANPSIPSVIGNKNCITQLEYDCLQIGGMLEGFEDENNESLYCPYDRPNFLGGNINYDKQDNQNRCSYENNGERVYFPCCQDNYINKDNQPIIPVFCRKPVVGGTIKIQTKIHNGKKVWDDESPILECTEAGYTPNLDGTACIAASTCPAADEEMVGGVCQKKKINLCVLDIGGEYFEEDGLCVVEGESVVGRFTTFDSTTNAWGTPQCYVLDGQTNPSILQENAYWTAVRNTRLYYDKDSYLFYENPNSVHRECVYDSGEFSWGGSDTYRYSAYTQDTSIDCSITSQDFLGGSVETHTITNLDMKEVYKGVLAYGASCDAGRVKLQCYQGALYERSLDYMRPFEIADAVDAIPEAAVFPAPTGGSAIDITKNKALDGYYTGCQKKCDGEKDPGTTLPFFTQQTVPFGGNCETNKKDFTCQTNGNWKAQDGSLDGFYTACTVASASDCVVNTGDFGNITVPHGQTENVYRNDIVGVSESCVAVTASCSNGTITYSDAGTGTLYKQCHQKCEETIAGSSQVFDPDTEKFFYKQSLLPHTGNCDASENTVTVKCVPSDANNTSSLSFPEGISLESLYSICLKCAADEFFTEGACIENTCGALESPFNPGTSTVNLSTIDGSLVCTPCNDTEKFVDGACIPCQNGEKRSSEDPARCVENLCPFGYKRSISGGCEVNEETPISNQDFSILKVNGNAYTEGGGTFFIPSSKREGVLVTIQYPKGFRVVVSDGVNTVNVVNDSPSGTGLQIQKKSVQHEVRLPEGSTSQTFTFSLQAKEEDGTFTPFNGTQRILTIASCPNGKFPNSGKNNKDSAYSKEDICEAACPDGMYLTGNGECEDNKCANEASMSKMKDDPDSVLNSLFEGDDRVYRLACCSARNVNTDDTYLWQNGKCVQEDFLALCEELEGVFLNGKCSLCGGKEKIGSMNDLEKYDSTDCEPEDPERTPVPDPFENPKVDLEQIKGIIEQNLRDDDEEEEEEVSGVGSTHIPHFSIGSAEEMPKVINPLDADADILEKIKDIKERKVGKWNEYVKSGDFTNADNIFRSPFVEDLNTITANIHIRAKKENNGLLGIGDDLNNIVIRWQVVGKLYDDVGNENGTIALVSNFNKISDQEAPLYGCGTGVDKFMVCAGDFDDALPQDKYKNVVIKNIAGKIIANTTDPEILSAVQEANLSDTGESNLTTLNDFIRNFDVAFPELIIYYENPISLNNSYLDNLEYRLEFGDINSSSPLPLSNGTFTISAVGESSGFQQRLQSSYSPQSLLPIFNYVLFTGSE